MPAATTRSPIRPVVRIERVRSSEKALSLWELDQGRRLTLQSDCGSLYLLWLGLEGTIELDHRQGVDCIPPDSIVLRHAHEGMSLSGREPARGIVAFIPSEALHRRIQESRGHGHSVPVEFSEAVSGNRPKSLATRLLADCLKRLVETEPSRNPPEDFSRAETILLSLLMEIIPYRRADAPAGGQRPLPWYITTAEKHMEDRITEPVSMRSLAQLTGMNERTLHEAFRKHRGYSPMKFLRERRMLRVNRELTDAEEHTTVTEVALKWGFCHLSRFSSYYCARFGERPSDTLQRARLGAVSRSQPGRTTRAIRLAASSSTA
jgi:AraC-like DNA-binding protein